MIAWRSMMVAALVLSAAGVGCSASAVAPVVTPTQSPAPLPSRTPSVGPTGSPSVAPSSTGSPAATATPGPSAMPTPSPSPASALSGSLGSIVVCAQSQQTCGVDLNADASTGDEAVVLVKGVNGSLTVSNSGGPTVASISDQVYSSGATSTEYEVIYKTATSSAGTDTLTIGNSGAGGSLVIPVTIVLPGDDAGPDFFALDTTSGIVCPGTQMTFGTTAQGGAPIELTASDSSLLTIAQNGGPNFVLNLLRAGSGYVTATSGSASIVYPANIPVVGFTSSC